MRESGVWSVEYTSSGGALFSSGINYVDGYSNDGTLFATESSGDGTSYAEKLLRRDPDGTWTTETSVSWTIESPNWQTWSDIATHGSDSCRVIRETPGWGITMMQWDGASMTLDDWWLGFTYGSNSLWMLTTEASDGYMILTEGPPNYYNHLYEHDGAGNWSSHSTLSFAPYCLTGRTDETVWAAGSNGDVWQYDKNETAWSEQSECCGGSNCIRLYWVDTSPPEAGPGGGGGGGGASASGGSGGGILFKSVKIDCTSGTINAIGGNAASIASGGSGGDGYLSGPAGSSGNQGGGGGGGRIKLFSASPTATHLVEPTTDVSGGTGNVAGSSGTYTTAANEAMDCRKIYQEGGVYLQRFRVKLL